MTQSNSIIGALLLAAGTSSRFGSTNKLLAQYKGKPLVSHVAGLIASSTQFTTKAAITGHDSENVEELLTNLEFKCLYNKEYKTGMASSVKLGIANMAHCDAIMVFPADMPQLSEAVISSLFTSFASISDKATRTTNKNSEPLIIVPTQNGKRGNPVVLTAGIFATAMSMTGDIGARQLFSQHEKKILEVQVTCEGIHHDVDRQEDFDQL